MIKSVLLVAAACALGACGEKPQGMGGGRNDAAPFAGPATAYSAPGWKAGDKNSWEQQLKVRTQNGQNDYSKAN